MTPEQLDISALLISRIASLRVSAKFLGVNEGPIVSVYRFVPIGRSRVSHLEALSADLAVATGSAAVLVKRLPNESAVGVFVPNKVRKDVYFRDAVAELSKDAHKEKAIPLALGIDNFGNFIIEDLAKMPHLLIAGSTNSGKSTLLNSIIAAIVYSVDSCSLSIVISDTKGVEFGGFASAPHVMFEPSTTVYETCEKLEWLCEETERRLKKFAKRGCRNIYEFNTLQPMEVFGVETFVNMSFIVLVIDELADLLTDRTKHETSGLSINKLAASQISRIVSRSRAVGIHMIASTQRPSVDVVSGVIKSNFPARISFRLPTQVDSRTVLGTGGAEHLLSQGDMLFLNPSKPGIQRIHAPLTPTEDVNAIIRNAAAMAR